MYRPTITTPTHFWEISLAVANQQARLAAPAIAHDDEFLAVLWRRRNVCPRARSGGRR